MVLPSKNSLVQDFIQNGVGSSLEFSFLFQFARVELGEGTRQGHNELAVIHSDGKGWGKTLPQNGLDWHGGIVGIMVAARAIGLMGMGVLGTGETEPKIVLINPVPGWKKGLEEAQERAEQVRKRVQDAEISGIADHIICKEGFESVMSENGHTGEDEALGMTIIGQEAGHGPLADAARWRQIEALGSELTDGSPVNKLEGGVRLLAF